MTNQQREELAAILEMLMSFLASLKLQQSITSVYRLNFFAIKQACALAVCVGCQQLTLALRQLKNHRALSKSQN